jgi:hypothetical protein
MAICLKAQGDHLYLLDTETQALAGMRKDKDDPDIYVEWGEIDKNPFSVFVTNFAMVISGKLATRVADGRPTYDWSRLSADFSSTLWRLMKTEDIAASWTLDTGELLVTCLDHFQPEKKSLKPSRPETKGHWTLQRS